MSASLKLTFAPIVKARSVTTIFLALQLDQYKAYRPNHGPALLPTNLHLCYLQQYVLAATVNVK